MCQSLAPGRASLTGTVRSGRPASAPDVSAAAGRSSVQWQSVSQCPVNQYVSTNTLDSSSSSLLSLLSAGGSEEHDPDTHITLLN